MASAKPACAPPSSRGARDRVTIDLRGRGPQLQAQAARHHMTAAALVRRAVVAMLDDNKGRHDESSEDCADNPHTVKVTLRLPAVHAFALSRRARAADIAQGTYVASLIDGTPAPPLAPDHAQAIAALNVSSDRLCALSADLNAFMRLLGRAPTDELEPYKASLRALAVDVRAHLGSAASLTASLRAARGPR